MRRGKGRSEREKKKTGTPAPRDFEVADYASASACRVIGSPVPRMPAASWGKAVGAVLGAEAADATDVGNALLEAVKPAIDRLVTAKVVMRAPRTVLGLRGCRGAHNRGQQGCCGKGQRHSIFHCALQVLSSIKCCLQSRAVLRPTTRTRIGSKFFHHTDAAFLLRAHAGRGEARAVSLLRFMPPDVGTG